jgi:hypothetical protein
MTATEEFYAYPGFQLLTALGDHAAENDARATAALARRITLDQPETPEASALHLAQVLKRVRPELDFYLVANGRVEELAGDPQANVVRRVFYAVEEPLSGGGNVRQAFDERVKSLMTDVPDLPIFSHFHEAFRKDAGGRTNEGRYS